MKSALRIGTSSGRNRLNMCCIAAGKIYALSLRRPARVAVVAGCRSREITGDRRRAMSEREQRRRCRGAVVAYEVVVAYEASSAIQHAFSMTGTSKHPRAHPHVRVALPLKHLLLTLAGDSGGRSYPYRPKI